MAEKNKATFKDLLVKHSITFEYLYEYCIEVPTTDIDVLYKSNIGVVSLVNKMLAFVNKEAGTSYTIEDIYIAQLY